MTNEQWATDEQIEHARQVMARINAEAASKPDKSLDIYESSTNKKSVAAARTEERAKILAERGKLMTRLDNLTAGTGEMRRRMMRMESQCAQAQEYVTQLQAHLKTMSQDDIAVVLQNLQDVLSDVPRPS